MKTLNKEEQAGIWNSLAYVAFIQPFCIIRPDNEPDFSVELNEINQNTYNHGKLCRIVAALQSPDLEKASLLVCADGAIAVPAITELKEIDDVLDILNGVMCCLLLGGHLCEAVDSRDVVHGNLHEKRAIWPTNFGKSLNAHIHSTMRMKIASTTETIRLLNPKNISVGDFFNKYQKGRTILSNLTNFSSTLFLRGFTELRYRNLVDALSNLWIVVEQLTDHLWEKHFVADPANHPKQDIPHRRKALREDARTWSTSIRQEILFQKAVLPSSTFVKLHPARKARNDLVHEGRRPALLTVENLFSAVLDLLHLASGIDPVALRAIDIREQDVILQRAPNDLVEWNETTSQQGISPGS